MSREILEPLEEETIVLDDCGVKGITVSLLRDSNNQPRDIRRAVISYISGGNFYHSSRIDPADDGSDGAIPEFSSLSPKFIIHGFRNIENWQGIKASGASDVSLSIVLEGVSSI